MTEQWYCPKCGYKDADTVYCSCGEMLDRYPLPPFVTAMQEEIAEQKRLLEGYRVHSMANSIMDTKHRERIAALEKVAESAPELERVKYAWALYCGRGSKWEDAWREAGYLKEEG